MFDDVIPCLEKLKGHRLGIITNGDSAQQRHKLQKIGITSYFDVVVAAGDIGSAKPNADIFLTACQLAQVAPDESYYVGDNLETDIYPCEKIGMKGIWLNRGNRGTITDKVTSIQHLQQLQAIVSG